ncbi:MAG TPA: DUF2336 domain-containing protein [Caulobacteraceae bacterium]|jgi:uncharacterized protein (DUF2336 family)|nr:DUF2336 domain-containing protein [Caulobacteraceae bacterium]
MSNASKLDELIALAREPSSARRRELLREVTDLFFSFSGPRGPEEMSLFDGVLTRLADEMEEEVRAELANRFAGAAAAPASLLKTLANDESGAVSGPLLVRSKALTENDLLEVASARGQGHLRMISGRSDLSEAVSDKVVERADDETLGVLLRNPKAPLSRQAAETVVDRAAANPALHEAVIDRQTLPIDLLNEMYFLVEARLRERILARNAGMDPGDLEAALAAGRRKVAERDGVLPSDYGAAVAHVKNMLAKGTMTPSALASLLRHGERTRFVVALSELADIDFHTANRIVDRQEVDALAIICKAADFDRTLFLTFTVLIMEPGKGMMVANSYGQRYAELPRDLALRTLRFWRMRRQTGDVAAA